MITNTNINNSLNVSEIKISHLDDSKSINYSDSDSNSKSNSKSNSNLDSNSDRINKLNLFDEKKFNYVRSDNSIITDNKIDIENKIIKKIQIELDNIPKKKTIIYFSKN